MFPLWGCGFENASLVAARLPPQDRSGRRALVNGKELKVPLLPMAALPLRRRLRPFIKFEIYGFSGSGSGATAAGTSKLCQPLTVSIEFRKKRRKSNIPMSPGSVTGFRAVEVGAAPGGILSRGILVNSLIPFLPSLTSPSRVTPLSVRLPSQHLLIQSCILRGPKPFLCVVTVVIN